MTTPVSSNARNHAAIPKVGRLFEFARRDRTPIAQEIGRRFGPRGRGQRHNRYALKAIGGATPPDVAFRLEFEHSASKICERHGEKWGDPSPRNAASPSAGQSCFSIARSTLHRPPPANET
jgi:hypothetical protein